MFCWQEGSWTFPSRFAMFGAMTRLVSLFALAVALAACSDDGASDHPDAGPGATSCVPLVGDDCLTPFPSIFFEKVDPTSPTGYRVSLDPDTMPRSTGGVAIRPDRLNQKDGFSDSSPFLVYFKDGVDKTQLPALADVATTITPASTVQLLEYDTGERVPRGGGPRL